MKLARAVIQRVFVIVTIQLVMTACCQIMPCSVGLTPTPPEAETLDHESEATNGEDEVNPQKAHSEPVNPAENPIEPAPRSDDHSVTFFNSGLNVIDAIGASADGKSLYVRSKKRNLVHLIRLEDQSVIQKTNYGGAGATVEFSKDSTVLIIVNGNRFNVYDVYTGKLAGFVEINPGEDLNVASKNGLVFASSKRITTIAGKAGYRANLKLGEELEFSSLESPQLLENHFNLFVQLGKSKTGRYFVFLYTIGWSSFIVSVEPAVTQLDPSVQTVSTHWDRGFYIQVLPEEVKVTWPVGTKRFATLRSAGPGWQFKRVKLSPNTSQIGMEYRRPIRHVHSASQYLYRWIQFENLDEFTLELKGPVVYEDLVNNRFVTISSEEGASILEVINQNSKPVITAKRVEAPGYWRVNGHTVLSVEDNQAAAEVRAVDGSNQFKAFSLKDGRDLWTVKNCNSPRSTRSILICEHKQKNKIHAYSMQNGSLIRSFEKKKVEEIELIAAKDQVAIALVSGKIALIKKKEKENLSSESEPISMEVSE